MTITASVRSEMVDPVTRRLIILPPRSSRAFFQQPLDTGVPQQTMSPPYLQLQLLFQPSLPSSLNTPLTATLTTVSQCAINLGTRWTIEEHARFLQGMEIFPTGPWSAIASVVGTRTAHQTMGHGQKYRLRIRRHKRGLLNSHGQLRASFVQRFQFRQSMITAAVIPRSITTTENVSSEEDQDEEQGFFCNDPVEILGESDAEKNEPELEPLPSNCQITPKEQMEAFMMILDL